MVDDGGAMVSGRLVEESLLFGHVREDEVWNGFTFMKLERGQRTV